MDSLRLAAVRTSATLWVAVLGFLVLAQPAHALFGSIGAALIAQGVGALALAALFALRALIRRQLGRLVAFVGRSRGLRAVVREVAVGALAAPSPGAGDANEAGHAAATSPRGTAPEWSSREATTPDIVGAAAVVPPTAHEPALVARG
jgi:hypothetical protein